jgi:hypothetical protein
MSNDKCQMTNGKCPAPAACSWLLRLVFNLARHFALLKEKLLALVRRRLLIQLMKKVLK